MINFWNSVFGIALTTIGIFLFISSIKSRKKDDSEDTFGNYIGIFSGEIGMIIIGLFMLIDELKKL